LDDDLQDVEIEKWNSIENKDFITIEKVSNKEKKSAKSDSNEFKLKLYTVRHTRWVLYKMRLSESIDCGLLIYSWCS
jgi:hypothetical protein